MGSSWFNRENEEDKIQKRAILDKNKKKFLKFFYSGLLIVGTTIGVILSGGLILYIDGGITLAYIISNLILNLYDKIIQKYMKYIPNSKKRDFKIEIHKFYEKILKDIVNDNDNNKLKDFVNKFIKEENILYKTSKQFEAKREKLLDESNKSKAKFNILVIGKTGSGKSTLINEFLQIRTAQENYGDVGTIGFILIQLLIQIMF
jgi:ABC-type bacteriocin/lantibiotic exporter with double-glycine peptidase domain